MFVQVGFNWKSTVEDVRVGSGGCYGKGKKGTGYLLILTFQSVKGQPWDLKKRPYSTENQRLPESLKLNKKTTKES